MRTWDFSLILSGIDADEDEGFYALWSACADEPMIGSYDGVSEVLFSRQAETVDDAVQSAIEDVERISGVRVIGLRDESFWSLADIADYSRHTPDEIRALIAQSTDTGFPQHLSDPGEPDPLWRAQEIVDWFQDEAGESVAHPAAAEFTALADTLQARSNRRQLEVEQQERVTGLLRG